MKRSFLTLVVFAIIFVTGCRENSITDPTPYDSPNKPSSSSNVYTGTMKLDYLLVYPGIFTSYYTLEGQIDFVHQLIQVDVMSSLPKTYVNLHLSMYALIKDSYLRDNFAWKVSEETDDVVFVSEDGVALLEKVYTVDGSDGMQLICRFQVTTDGVGLNEVFLANPEKGITGFGKTSDPPDTVTYPPVKNNLDRE